MNIKKYEKKINDIIMKCPIEAGVEILVYNMIDEFVEGETLSLVDINRIWKDKDSRLTTSAGIPDIAILSNDFQFGDTNKGEVYGFVEVKATGRKLNETEQVFGQKSEAKHYFYTNGLIWKYYKNQDLQGDPIFLTTDKCEQRTNFNPVSIDEEEYEKLISLLKGIDWNE